MPKYSLTKNGNVTQCKWNCECNHEHYVGTYERAVKYFGIDEHDIKFYGNLMNIIIYHQTSQWTVPKLSNELYQILMDAMSEHKYWVPKVDRHVKAMDTIYKAKKAGYIMDEKICETIDKIGNRNAKNRKWAYEKWCEQNDF